MTKFKINSVKKIYNLDLSIELIQNINNYINFCENKIKKYCFIKIKHLKNFEEDFFQVGTKAYNFEPTIGKDEFHREIFDLIDFCERAQIERIFILENKDLLENF